MTGLNTCLFRSGGPPSLDHSYGNYFIGCRGRKQKHLAMRKIDINYVRFQEILHDNLNYVATIKYGKRINNVFDYY